MYSNILEHVEEGRRKEKKRKKEGKEKKRRNERGRGECSEGGRKEEEKIKKKIADSIGGNEFKMAGPQLKWRRDVNNWPLCANMTFLFAIGA